VSRNSAATPGATEQYMRRLADGLDALPAPDRAEVLAEIRSHIAEATTESDGDEVRALEAFGGPEEMATRILTERGVVKETGGLQSAPGWMRWTALALDIAGWVLLLGLLLVVPLGVALYVGRVGAIVAWVYVAAIAGFAIWWWGWKRRRRGHTSAGMNVLGIRRVRVAGATRLVRATDLGDPKRSKGELAGSIIWAVFLLAVLAFAGLEWFATSVQNSASHHQQEIQNVADDTLQAENVLDNAYNAALKGENATDWFAPQAAKAEADLLARHTAGLFNEYHVDTVQWADYKPLPEGADLKGYVLTAVVQVSESRDGTDFVLYEYTVVERITDVQFSRQGARSTTSYSGQWKVEGVKQVGQ
jgi:hypothetical protein